MRAILPLLIVLGLTISCSSSKKKESAESVDGAAGSSVTYDSLGSDSGNIAGLQTVHFEYDKAILTNEARKILRKNAEWIRTNASSTMQVEGHCDQRGSIEYNLSLGERRANSVKSFLVSLGIEGRRLTTISYGKEKLLDPSDSEEAYSRNRRANFVPLAQ